MTLLGRELAHVLEERFEAYLEGSVEITRAMVVDRGWLERIAGWALYQVSRLC